MELERDIEKYLNLQVKKLRGKTLKLNTEVGIPDRLIILKNRIIFVEVKRSKGRISEIQKHRILELQNLGHEAYVIFSKIEVDNILERK
jgi:acyl-CoA thioesterase FadM